MPKYNRTWNTIDAGREVLWGPPYWYGLLEIASKYDGQDVYNPNSPIYSDLTNAFPNFPWKGNGQDFRPVFRDYPNPWKQRL